MAYLNCYVKGKKISLYEKLLFIYLLLLISITSLGNNGNDDISKYSTKIIPPAPDAASLGKYGNTPVGLHTGIPQINIPIYTIKTKSLEVPISLSYHASGIKVLEIASWVGLGWTLNAGGAISRTIVGKADDVSGFWDTNVRSHSQITPYHDFEYLLNAANGLMDGESDLYFYNFNGHSGKFVYHQNNKHTPLLIPEVPISVKFIQGRYEITDEFGTLYKFADVEYLGTGETIIPVSSFYLSEIVSADGIDRIYFNYSLDNSYSELSRSYTETIGNDCPDGVPVSRVHKKNFTSTTRVITPKRLESITYANGKVVFNKSENRLDIPSSRLEEIEVYVKNFDGSFSLVKSFSLNHDYFVSPTGTGEGRYRLKLVGLQESDKQRRSVRQHSFSYEENEQLPDRNSLAQDWWGYFNGQVGNTSLIATENVSFANQNYTIGGGNRLPNAEKMQAAILKKIIYPTGGYTEFDYEPHYFTGNSKVPKNISASSGLAGNTTDLLQQTVTFTPALSGWARINTSCSDVKDINPFFSRVILKEEGANLNRLNHVYDPYNFSPYIPLLNKEFWVYLTGGVSYELTVMSKGASNSTSLSGAAFAMATVYWEEIVSGETKMAGGLRLKEMRDYLNMDANPIVKLYRYGVNESGKGVILIPPGGLSSAKQEVDFIHYRPLAPSSCSEACRGLRMLISGETVHDLSSLNGAAVVYPEVTVYENSIGAVNGKQVFRFNVQEDKFYAAPKAYKNGTFQRNESWKGGDEIWSAVFKGNTNDKVKETSQEFAILNTKSAIGTKIGWKLSIEGTCLPPTYHQMGEDLFYIFDYEFPSGVKKLISSNEKNFSSADPSFYFEKTVEYKYKDFRPQHQQLFSQKTYENNGDVIETQYWYPADYNNVDIISTLLDKNIIATPLKTEQYVNNQLISGKVNKMNSDGKPLEIYLYETKQPQAPPPHDANTIVPPAYVKKIDIGYDLTTKNVNKVQQTDNVNHAYLWGYNNSLPVAKIDNANAGAVAYTSFESDGKGNWTYTGIPSDDIKAKTGNNYYRLSRGNVTRSLTTGTYRLEFWAKGTVSLSGGSITDIFTAPADADGWVLHVKEINITSNVTLSISGSSAYIDELRIYPVGAQIATYTYHPALGMTSMNDTNSKVTFYEYDDFGRLALIKDNDGNVVKKIEYNYQVR